MTDDAEISWRLEERSDCRRAADKRAAEQRERLQRLKKSRCIYI